MIARAGLNVRVIGRLSIACMWACSEIVSGHLRQRPITIEDAIETTRAMVTAPRYIERANGELVLAKPTKAIVESPDNSRYVLMLVRGDVRRNGVAAELLSGRLDSIQDAVPQHVTTLFTSGLGATTGTSDLSELTLPTFNPPRWIDNENVALSWEDQSHVKQVVSINVVSREVSYRTHHATEVREFAFSPGGLILMYSAAAPSRRDDASIALQYNGFAVTNADAISLAQGKVSDGSLYADFDYSRFVQSPTQTAPRRIEMPKGIVNRMLRPFVVTQFSPDGRSAVLDGSPSQIPAAWRSYRSEHLSAMFDELGTNPEGFYARQFIQLYIVDLTSAQARPLWNAPIDVTNLPRVLSWSPNGGRVVVGPTFVPISGANDAGISGHAIAVIDVNTGGYATLPISREAVDSLRGGRWTADTQIELNLIGHSAPVVFTEEHGKWLDTDDVNRYSVARQSRQTVHVELRESLDSPPAVYAIDSTTHAERMVYDCDPQLRSEFLLGHQEVFEFEDAAGRKWSGRLYYPVHFDRKRRYPLVIQYRQPAGSGEFSLYGQGGATGIGLGPGISVYLAQPLAGRGIATLQLGGPSRWSTDESSTSELEMGRIASAAFPLAVEKLASMGIVDPKRVGLMGHSATGWVVEYALTHSDFHYAAALASDNKDGSYFQDGLAGWPVGTGQELNGAPPFGGGLRLWLDNSPAFNADRVQSPLMLMTTDSIGGPLAPLLHWEMFSRLRYLKKPVELYVVPDLEHGTHSLQNPRQLIAVQQRALDWWTFWLKPDGYGGVRADTRYASWVRLEETQSRAGMGR